MRGDGAVLNMLIIWFTQWARASLVDLGYRQQARLGGRECEMQSKTKGRCWRGCWKLQTIITLTHADASCPIQTSLPVNKSGGRQGGVGSDKGELASLCRHSTKGCEKWRTETGVRDERERERGIEVLSSVSPHPPSSVPCSLEGSSLLCPQCQGLSGGCELYEDHSAQTVHQHNTAYKHDRCICFISQA